MAVRLSLFFSGENPYLRVGGMLTREKGYKWLEFGNFSSDSPLCLLFASSKPPRNVLGIRESNEADQKSQ